MLDYYFAAASYTVSDRLFSKSPNSLLFFIFSVVVAVEVFHLGYYRFGFLSISFFLLVGHVWRLKDARLQPQNVFIMMVIIHT